MTAAVAENRRLLLGVCIAVYALCCTMQLGAAQNLTSTAQKSSQLLVVILSGFRWDYCHDLHGFHRFQVNGSHAGYLVPAFPSLDYPNLYSIVTGLFPENHGMVGDVMYEPITKDVRLDVFYGMDSPAGTNPIWWNASDPIWVLATKNKKTAFAYSMPGCSVPIHATPPEVCRFEKKFDGTESLDMDLNEALKQLQSGSADLAMVYSSYLDDLGRLFGPNSEDVAKGTVSIDGHIDKLVTQVEDMGLKDKLNIIIASDHGMAPVDENRKMHVELGSLSNTGTEIGVNFDDLEFVLSYGAFAGIYPKADKINKVFEDLAKHEGIHVYKRKDIPDRLHIKLNNRTAPIIVIAKKGYYIDKATQSDKQYPPNALDTVVTRKGAAGYDPEEVHDMRGIFLVRGPAFKKNVTVDSVSAVDIYNIMTCALNITGHQNNGSKAVACKILKKDCNSFCSTAAVAAAIHHYFIICIAAIATLVSANFQ